MPGIDGKVVAITGASGGVGEATALLLGARRDARLRRAPTGSARGSRPTHNSGRRRSGPRPHGRQVARRSHSARRTGVAALRQTRRSRQQRGHRPDLSARRVPGRGIGGDDRRQHQRRPLRHRRGAAPVPWPIPARGSSSVPPRGAKTALSRPRPAPGRGSG
jgi:hypothetical protein